MRSNTKKVLSVALSVLILALPVTAWAHRQDIYDWSRLRDYKPSADVEGLAISTTMNDNGKKIFYVNHPSLEDKQSFNGHCTDSEKSVVLGCYINRQGIYIYNVGDQRLDGVKEVTAAHEMLHAAYDRLPKEERARIDNLVTNTYRTLDNDRIKKTIENYRVKDPSVVPNELHSILGTEVRELPAELEEHYKQYFTNRVQIVIMSEGYEKAFTERQNREETLLHDIQSLKKQIEANEANLTAQAADLASERKRMEALSAAKHYEEYNAAVPGFNQRVRAYNALVTTTQSLIDQHNAKVKDFNDLAAEYNSLIKAIDSRPETLETQN